MPTPSRKTPARVARMLELYRGGGSAREIGEVLGVSHRTVTVWLREAGLEAHGGTGARKSRRRPELSQEAAAIVDAAAAAVGPSPRNQLEALEDARETHERVKRLLAKAIAIAETGTGKASDVALYVRLVNEQDIAIKALTPPEAVDPDVDPANLEAAARVRAKVEGLVATAEAAFRCSECGRSPYAAGKRAQPGGDAR